MKTICEICEMEHEEIPKNEEKQPISIQLR